MATQLQSFGSLNSYGPRTEPAPHFDLRLMLILREGSTLGALREDLVAAGYSLYLARSWKEILLQFPFARPDLILLNVGVPDTNGKEILHQLRDWTSAPVVVISAPSHELQRIEFLDAGADDYLTKSLELGEILARLRAASRRAFGIPRDQVFHSGNLEVDFSRREARVENRQIKLSVTEYDLLKVLAGHAGRVQSYYQLIHEVWGGTQYQDALHLLRVTVCNLRRKLLSGSGLASHIVTEPGIGYRLRCDSQNIHSARIDSL
jgi:two-component system KDP operon response regulator KdpE